MAPIGILIADDNVDAADSLSMLLAMEGHNVFVARNGLEALELADKIRPEIIFLDIGMPKLNGFDTCKMIRTCPWAEASIVVAVTGWATDADRIRSKYSGFNHHFAKPIEPTQVRHILSLVPRVRED